MSVADIIPRRNHTFEVRILEWVLYIELYRNCAFCRILKNELSLGVVFEDAHSLAFFDIHPIAEGHTLVVPRRQAESFTDLSADAVSRLAQVGRVVAEQLKKAIKDCRGVSLSLADGVIAGQEVPHAHLHVIVHLP